MQSRIAALCLAIFASITRRVARDGNYCTAVMITTRVHQLECLSGGPLTSLVTNQKHLPPQPSCLIIKRVALDEYHK